MVAGMEVAIVLRSKRGPALLIQTWVLPLVKIILCNSPHVWRMTPQLMIFFCFKTCYTPAVHAMPADAAASYLTFTCYCLQARSRCEGCRGRVLRGGGPAGESFVWQQG